MFYETLMEKSAEQNYHSRYLSETARNKAFDQANKRRAARTQGQHSSRNAGGVAGGVLGGLAGGLIGGAHRGVGGALVGGGAGALLGGGLGYGMGYIGDKARDARTRQAQKIMKMSPKARAELLDTKRARRLEFEDRMQRRQERQERREIRNELRAMRMERQRSGPAFRARNNGRARTFSFN